MGLFHSPTIITDGLVMYLDAENQKGSRVTWSDLVGGTAGGSLSGGTRRNIKGSALFAGGYLSFPITDGVKFTGDFTIECWFYGNSFSAAGMFAFPHNASNFASVLVYVNGTSAAFYSSNDGTSWNVASGSAIGTIQTGKWHHLAISRQGSSIRLFLDGVLGSTVTNGASLWNALFDRCYIGDTTGNSTFDGYISNFRVVNGTALYTANFTPSTFCELVTGTSLLTCRVGIIDESENLVTITSAGTVTPQTENALIFNAAGTQVALPATVGYTGNVSAFAWIKTNGAPRGGYHIVFGPTSLEISIPTSGELRTGVDTSAGRFVSNHGSNLVNGAWHYVGFTFDGINKKSYIDGQYVGTFAVTGSLTYNIASRSMGVFGQGDATYGMNGSISSAKIYNRSLTDAEVTKNFNALKGRYGL